jgi:Cu/Ag efflux protein CusF
MRRFILAMMLTLVASWAVAQEPAAQAPAPSKDAKEMTAVVVNTDVALKTITVQKDAGLGQAGSQPETTLPVEEKAIANLKTLKVGQKVKLILKTDPMTKRESVSSIEKPNPERP